MSGLPAAADEGGEPIERREDAVLDRARLDVARPADDARRAEAAFIHGALGALERRHAAVGPGEHLGAIVGGEDDDGVVGLADVLEMLQEGADAVVHLRHAGFLETVVASGCS